MPGNPFPFDPTKEQALINKVREGDTESIKIIQNHFSFYLVEDFINSVDIWISRFSEDLMKLDVCLKLAKDLVEQGAEGPCYFLVKPEQSLLLATELAKDIKQLAEKKIKKRPMNISMCMLHFRAEKLLETICPPQKPSEEKAAPLASSGLIAKPNKIIAPQIQSSLIRYQPLTNIKNGYGYLSSHHFNSANKNRTATVKRDKANESEFDEFDTRSKQFFGKK